ncbi:MAG: ankyrin repeat domain-containing protein [Acidobacteriia bacterium]|nr:ankyrin repeat domain-containing protein [Terriglobia bacterium]
MDTATLLDRIRRGRTDLMVELLRHPDWRALLREGEYTPLQWCVYYNDVTAMRAVLAAGGDLGSIDLNEELGHASFFGHWKVCDFLILHGADVNHRTESGETPLHNALAKAGRPYFLYVVRLLVEHGADVNARTVAGRETAAFMRDVRTKRETPLHRAAAYADAATLRFLLGHGADREARDANGDSPLTWASEHQRPGAILAMLAFPPHRIGLGARTTITSDHGAGWGNGMEWHFLGDYLPESNTRS